MTLNSSFLAGVATVFATVLVGFAAGVTMTKSFVGPNVREPNRLERSLSDQRAEKTLAVVTPSQDTAINAKQAPMPPVVPQAVAPQAQTNALATESDLKNTERDRARAERKKRPAEQRRQRWASPMSL